MTKTKDQVERAHKNDCPECHGLGAIHGWIGKAQIDMPCPVCLAHGNELQTQYENQRYLKACESGYLDV